ncbi:MAG: deoxynucleoside kinase [Anaerolineae bacterium]|jgi:deoxyadenosine/deoxycytidine kinase
MRPFFLAIEGPIGVGKTTLVRLLQPRFKSELLLEKFEENPFLSSFYDDRARYAFQTQMFFLLSRYRQQQTIPSVVRHGPLVTDYLFEKDSLFAQLNLVGDELEMYQRLYAVLSERVTSPDLVVYLRADLDALMARIAMRDRPYEREMDRAYIDSVRQAYEEYFTDYVNAPLLPIDTNNLNYVHDPGALAFVESQVRTALGIGAYQQALPAMESVAAPRVTGAPAASPGAREPRSEEALKRYLAANEAMGRVGAILADAVSRDFAARQLDLGQALSEVMQDLQSLARATGSGMDGS